MSVRSERAHSNEAQAEALLRAGCLASISYGFADGTAGIRYEITPQGQDAWKAYRFD
jgi:hypothetical protein